MEWKYPFATFLVPESNVGGSELVAVGSRKNAESGGAFDLVGNAAEWTSTGSPGDKAVVGASFRDAAWSYNFPHPLEPMQRLDDVGFLREFAERTARIPIRHKTSNCLLISHRPFIACQMRCSKAFG